MSNARETAPGLLILGMHRSGTSCLAGMLECTGFHVGDVDEWNPYNLKGNRENLAASAINEALLHACGADWDRPPEQLRIAAHHREDIRRLTDELAASGRPWLLKDPRMLLVLGAWTDTVPDLARVGIFRHPVAVARSLQRRDDTDLETGVALWRAYNKRLLQALELKEFPLIAFNGEPDHLERAVAGTLQSLFPVLLESGVLEAKRAGDFFDRNLVHHAQPVELDITDDLAALSLPTHLVDAAQDTWTHLLERQGPVHLAAGETRRERSAENISSNDDSLRPGEPLDARETADLEALDAQIERSGSRIDLFRQGMASFEARQDPAGLKSWLGAWCERLPDDPFLHWELANLHWEGGDREAAIEHAVEARRLAPSWITPTRALAKWAFETEHWKLAADANRALYAAQFSRAKDRTPAAELFVDSGKGFNGGEATEQLLRPATRSVHVRFDDRELLRGMKNFRLDPLNQAVVMTDLQVVLIRDGGEPEPVQPTSSNAELTSAGVYYFTTDDPQLHFALDLAGTDAVVGVEARYRLAQVGADVPGEVIRRLQVLLREAATSQRDGDNPSLLARFLGDRQK
jgi:hypothetical protein